MTRTALLATALAPLCALAAHSQVTGGTLSGELALDPVAWAVSDEESYWREAHGGREIRLVAVPQNAGPEAADAPSLAIAFMVSGTASAPEPMDISVTYDEPGMADLAAGDANTDITLTAFELQGEDLVISGDVVATMVEGGTNELLIDPPEEATRFDGNFSATLVRRPAQ